MIRLIASDIDGTLLHGGAASIPPVIFQEIVRLGERGIRFCPASGRQYESLRRLFAPVAEKLYYICENGAVVFGPGSPGPVLAKTEMERGLAEALAREIIALPRCEVMISGVNTSYLCPKDGRLGEHLRNFIGNNVAVVPSPSAVPEAIIKVSAFCWDGALAIQPVLAPRWEQHFQAAIAGQEWLDFTLSDKGAALDRLCAGLGVAMDEVMAFGDNYNDLSMLEAAGVPYIMDNAAEDLRRRIPNHCRRVEEVLAGL